MHSLEIKEVLDKLNTSVNGLSINEAEKRLHENGKNELDKVKKVGFLKRFFKQFANIMIIILLISAIVSISVALINKEYSDLFEGFVILFIVIMNALIGVFQESKAQACIDDLQKYNKVFTRVLRSGNYMRVDSVNLVKGDVVELEAGNMIMADMRLMETNNFCCDESSLTGESLAVEKDAQLKCSQNEMLAERKNMAYSGSLVTRGRAKAVVVATGRETEIGKIANLIFSSQKETTPLQKSIDKIGKIITWTVLAVCFVVLMIELFSGGNFIDALLLAVSLAVAAIPESLPAVITIIMALGVQQLAKRKCVIKRLHAVETLGCCEIVCTDKTGTLTMNKMQVVTVYANRGYDLNNDVNEDFLQCMKMCNNSKFENGKIVGEPTEIALYHYSNERYLKQLKQIVHEMPFDSTRKMMTVMINDGGLKSFTKGAPEKIIDKCDYIKINGEIKVFTAQLKEEVINANNQMADRALRVVGFACKEFSKVDLGNGAEQGMVFLGLAGMLDKPRPEVKESVKKCVKAGLKPVMITGDHKRTAFAIATELGIASRESEVITGAELDRLSDKELSKCCANYSVYARVTPEHKVRIVKAFKGLKKIVAMTGDGVNDAPSLKIADIGVGMGKNGTDVVKNVADMLVTDDNFSSIVVGIEEGRKVYNNIQKALQFLISTNCVEVFGMLIALIFFPKYTFMLPAQMLFINLVTDSLPAFALGVEKVEKEVMEVPPRNAKAGLFSGKVGMAIVYQSVLQTVIVMAVFLIGVFCYSPNEASTMVFFTIIFMQLLHSVNCKTNNSIFEKNLFENKTFNICFLITLALNIMVACVPFMYTLFNLQFLNLSQWIVIVIASILIIPTCELFKIILNDDKKYLKNSKK